MRTALVAALAVLSCVSSPAAAPSASPTPSPSLPPAPRSASPTPLTPAAALALRVYEEMLAGSSGKVRETTADVVRLWKIQRPDGVTLDVSGARAERWIVVGGQAWHASASEAWSLLGYEAQLDSVTLALRSGRAVLQRDQVACAAGLCAVLLDALLQATLVIDPRRNVLLEARLPGMLREYYDYDVLNDIRPPDAKR